MRLNCTGDNGNLPGHSTMVLRPGFSTISPRFTSRFPIPVPRLKFFRDENANARPTVTTRSTVPPLSLSLTPHNPSLFERCVDKGRSISSIYLRVIEDESNRFERNSRRRGWKKGKSRLILGREWIARSTRGEGAGRRKSMGFLNF